MDYTVTLGYRVIGDLTPHECRQLAHAVQDALDSEFANLWADVHWNRGQDKTTTQFHSFYPISSRFRPHMYRVISKAIAQWEGGE